MARLREIPHDFWLIALEFSEYAKSALAFIGGLGLMLLWLGFAFVVLIVGCAIVKWAFSSIF
jgi:hypothetical protein